MSMPRVGHSDLKGLGMANKAGCEGRRGEERGGEGRGGEERGGEERGGKGRGGEGSGSVVRCRCAKERE